MQQYEAVWDKDLWISYKHWQSQGLPLFCKHLIISEPPFGANDRVHDDGRRTAMNPAQLFGQGDLYIL